MRKKLLIISILALLLGFFAPVTQTVLADSNNAECVAVIGVGEVCVEANIAEINFMIACKEESMEELSSCAQDKKQKINSLLAEQGEIAESLSTEFLRIRPVFENGTHYIEQCEGLKLKTTNLENVNNIINVLISNGAIFRGEVIYSIENYNEEYNKALQLAKENAIQKANLLGSNLTLEKICEEYYCYCTYSSANNCIKIEARIKAVFESDESYTEENIWEQEKETTYEETSEQIETTEEITEQIETTEEITEEIEAYTNEQYE